MASAVSMLDDPKPKTGGAKRSLASILREYGAIPVTDAVDIALDVCDELAYAHANGVVHGDLSPQRIRLIWPRKIALRVEIFRLGDDSGIFGQPATGGQALVSPEQRQGRQVDRRADIWAVGALLHWMLTGAPPGVAHVKAAGAIQNVVARCLAKSPNDRPQSVDEIAEVLGSFSSSPADRFEQLAWRRSMKSVELAPSEFTDVGRVLGRLDDAALARELLSSAPASKPRPAPMMMERSQSTVQGESSEMFVRDSEVEILDDSEVDTLFVVRKPRAAGESAPLTGAELQVVPASRPAAPPSAPVQSTPASHPAPMPSYAMGPAPMHAARAHSAAMPSNAMPMMPPRSMQPSHAGPMNPSWTHPTSMPPSWVRPASMQAHRPGPMPVAAAWPMGMPQVAPLQSAPISAMPRPSTGKVEPAPQPASVEIAPSAIAGTLEMGPSARALPIARRKSMRAAIANGPSPVRTPLLPTVIVRAQPSRFGGRMLTVLGALVAVALGVGIGVKGVERFVLHQPTVETRPTPVAPPVEAPAAKQSGPAPSTPAQTASATSANTKPAASSVAEPAAVPVMSPSSLPDARRVHDVRPAPRAPHRAAPANDAAPAVEAAPAETPKSEPAAPSPPATP